MTWISLYLLHDEEEKKITMKEQVKERDSCSFFKSVIYRRSKGQFLCYNNILSTLWNIVHGNMIIP